MVHAFSPKIKIKNLLCSHASFGEFLDLNKKNIYYICSVHFSEIPLLDKGLKADLTQIINKYEGLSFEIW